jgi:hypothetical protein
MGRRSDNDDARRPGALALGGNVIRKARIAVIAGVSMALGVSAMAYADGASENEPDVVGSVKPAKLDKKKYKPVTLFSGVATTGTVPGFNPEQEMISWGKNEGGADLQRTDRVPDHRRRAQRLPQGLLHR